MPSFNKVILMGSLTAKPELRYTDRGKALTSFTVAINDHYLTTEGEPAERVTFVEVSATGKQAETLSKFLNKGSPILVDGLLTTERWQDEDGTERSKLSVALRRFEFVGGRPKLADSET